MVEELSNPSDIKRLRRGDLIITLHPDCQSIEDSLHGVKGGLYYYETLGDYYDKMVSQDEGLTPIQVIVDGKKFKKGGRETWLKYWAISGAYLKNAKLMELNSDYFLQRWGPLKFFRAYISQPKFINWDTNPLTPSTNRNGATGEKN